MVLPNSFVEAKFLSTGQVATELGVHRSTVWSWIKSGLLKHTVVGSHYGIRPKDVTRLLQVYTAPRAKQWAKKYPRKNDT